VVAASGLLDTNTVILLPRLRDRSVLPEATLISAITLAELSVGPLVASDDEERVARQAELQEAEASFDAIPFAGVASSLRRSGRKPTARTFDAMIAAVAVANALPLFTCNPGDFAGIDGLTVVAIPHPDTAHAKASP